jgi:ubiquinone/menaquinone biosynthesis C-methylase UbiE
MNEPKFTGERLIPGSKILSPMRIENLARFNFFRSQVSGSLFLDLGCGAGEGTIYLAEDEESQVYGADLDHDALVYAQQLYQNQNAKFIQMNAEQIAFKGECFDGIISVEVIEHIPDPNAYLAEVCRILRKGGIFILTTPNKLRSSSTPGSLWPEHLREYTPEELRDLLKPVFHQVEMWGEEIPVYESHPLRRLVRRFAPVIKPILPHWVRIRALPALQTIIKSDIQMDEVKFTTSNIREMPTLVAICRK